MAGKKTEKKESKKAATLSKSGLINAVVDAVGDVSRKQVKAVFDALTEVGHKELKKAGIFTVPGFAKFVVKKKKGTPAGERRNPFNGEMKFYPAKPASKTVRARPVKAIKDAVA
jgi:DNA-binding protein HU-beta